MSANQEGSLHPVFVLGISGATWEIIHPLIDAGHLPNLSRLMERGCSATLLSCRAEGDKHYRPQTAWPTIATGFVPKKHGVTHFWCTASDLKVRNLWDYIIDANGTVGLYGWPMTWPPSELPGFIIPCHHARDSKTWPPELGIIKKLDRWQQNKERSVARGGGFKSLLCIATLLFNGVSIRRLPLYIHKAFSILHARNDEQKALILRDAKLELSTDLFIHLYKKYKPDFAAFVSFFADFVSHRYWRYHEPESFSTQANRASQRLRGGIKYSYMAIDRALGRIIKVLPPSATIAVISEHGMAVEQDSAEVGDYRYLILGNQLTQFVGLSGRIDACPVARWVALRPKPGQAMPTDVAERLSEVAVIETGLPLFNVYEHGSDEVIVKFNISSKVLRYKQGNLDSLHVAFRGKVVPFQDVAKRLGLPRSAMHDKRGIIILSGPGIRHGIQLPDAKLVDVAPTLLRCIGVPYPNNLPGEVLDIF